MFVRSKRIAFACAVGLAAASSLTACGSGGGNAGAGNLELVTLVTSTVADGTTGVAYTAQFVADFPHPPGRFLITGGALPPGLALDNQTGLLAGYPRQTGVFSFEIGARDGSDSDLPPNRDANFAEDRGNFRMVIALGPPNILPQQPPAAQYRASYGYQIDIAGGTPPYIFQQVGGTLPTGLTVSTSGLLGNFPQAETAGGEPYEFDVRVTDANLLTDTEHLSVDVVVLPLIILTTSPLQSAAQNFPYLVQLQLASAGAGQPITWSQKLPLAAGEVLLSSIGMELTNQGQLREAAPNPGPTGVGTYLFSARVTDEAGQIASRQYSLKISPGPVLIAINPKKGIAPPPFLLTGLNFQPGAVVIFKPGPSQVQVNPSGGNITPTQITLVATPPTPGGGGGFVTVRVLNPDGGFSDLPAAFAFPAANLTFSTTPTFPTPQSALSSTGLAVGDVNKDGFADIVHVGSQGSGSWSNGTPTSGGVHLMLNTPPAGGFDGTFNQLVLNSGGDFQSVKLHDVDTDNDLDIVAMGRIGGQLRVRTWLNPYPVAFTAGTASTDTVATYDSGQHMGSVALGRLSPSDSVPDVAYTVQDFPQSTTTSTWNSYGGTLTSMQGAGNGTFNLALDSLSGVAQFYAMSDVVLAEFNGDTKDDAFVGDQAGGYNAWNWGGGGPQGVSGQASLTNPASGLFGSFTPLSRGNGVLETLGVAAGDVNGDSRADIVAPTSNAWTTTGGTTGVGVFQGSGSGTFTSVPPQAGSGRPRFAAVFDADFDFPGDVAITVADNKIDIYKGRSASSGLQFKQALTVTGAPKMGRIATGDFNADGREDVCGAMSFFADNRFTHQGNAADRGNGSPTGVVIFLNTSN